MVIGWAAGGRERVSVHRVLLAAGLALAPSFPAVERRAVYHTLTQAQLPGGKRGLLIFWAACLLRQQDWLPAVGAKKQKTPLL